MAKLAALIPPPRFNTVRYHGVLAAAASLRSSIVPEGPGPDETALCHEGCAGSAPVSPPALEQPPNPAPRRPPRPRNYSWAELMRRVFAVDVLECPACDGRMRIIAALHAGEAIQAILECLGLPSRAPPIAAAVAEPEEDEMGGGFVFDPIDA